MKKYTILEAEQLRDTYKNKYAKCVVVDKYADDERQVIYNLVNGYYIDESEFYSDLDMIYKQEWIEGDE